MRHTPGAQGSSNLPKLINISALILFEKQDGGGGYGEAEEANVERSQLGDAPSEPSLCVSRRGRRFVSVCCVCSLLRVVYVGAVMVRRRRRSKGRKRDVGRGTELDRAGVSGERVAIDTLGLDVASAFFNLSQSGLIWPFSLFHFTFQCQNDCYSAKGYRCWRPGEPAPTAYTPPTASSDFFSLPSSNYISENESQLQISYSIAQEIGRETWNLDLGSLSNPHRHTLPPPSRPLSLQ